MAYYLFKMGLTSVLVVLISEIGKRSSLMGAILASIPLISVLAMTWLYVETRDVASISELSTSIFWLVLPSLVLFLALPLLLRQGVGFYTSLAIAVGLTVLSYWLMIMVLTRVGIRL